MAWLEPAIHSGAVTRVIGEEWIAESSLIKSGDDDGDCQSAVTLSAATASFTTGSPASFTHLMLW